MKQYCEVRHTGCKFDNEDSIINLYPHNLQKGKDWSVPVAEFDWISTLRGSFNFPPSTPQLLCTTMLILL